MWLWKVFVVELLGLLAFAIGLDVLLILIGLIFKRNKVFKNFGLIKIAVGGIIHS